MENMGGGYGRGARTSYTNNNDFNNGFDMGGGGYNGGPLVGVPGPRGFGTGDLRSYGYQGPPPLSKG